MGPRGVASLAMSTVQAWRLLTDDLPAAGQAHFVAVGESSIIGMLLWTWAIIGTP